MLVMFKTVLRVGSAVGFGVVGLFMTQAAIDKYEKKSEERNTKKTIELKSEVEEEITEEDIQAALEKELKQ
jgi:hypothetical protein